ncbi:MAG: prepilin peptidase, partial [Bdellovibrionales bacterium]|nr:prepilin peptidase [Bdellovibrionales bacterium]
YQLKWYDNIPILSWCLLLGKCRKCGSSISYRYPLVELLCGVFFVFTYLKLGICWTLLEYQIFAFSLLVVSFIDFDHYILPDVFTLSGIVIGLLGALINPERQFMDSLYGVLMGGGFLWAIAYVYWLLRKQEGMGGGDIKLLAWIGAVVGWQSIAFVILVSSILGGLVGIVVGIQKKEGLQSTIPFGPYLALGALLYIWVGEELTNWYLNLFIPGIA